MYIDVDYTITQNCIMKRAKISSEPSGETIYVQAPKQPVEEEEKHSDKPESSTKPITCPDCKKSILKTQFGGHRRWHCNGKKVKALS
jgi:hypothetical protein